jgi:hypothetical protein
MGRAPHQGAGFRLVAPVLLACALLACSRGPRYAVDRVVVVPSPAMRSLESAGIAGATLGATATRQLEKTSSFVSPDSAGTSARRFLAQVEVERAEVRAATGTSGTSAHVTVTVSLEPLDGGSGLREIGRGSALLDPGPAGLRVGLEKAALNAVGSAINAFSMQLAAEKKKSPELLRDLASKDPGVRDHAMRVLAARGDREAVPALLERLRDPDPAARERAIGALAQLRDPRAVSALIELVHRREPQYVAQVARIIGDIGGDDARAWLLTMAYGHPEEVVRSAAHEALADMKARELHAARTERP